MTDRNLWAKYCFPCSDIRTKESLRRARERKPQCKWAQRAHHLVARAIKNGMLPSPKTLDCMDCGWGAQCYDHRDYNKPLAVDPVCFSCNCKRGAATPHVECEVGTKGDEKLARMAI